MAFFLVATDDTVRDFAGMNRTLEGDRWHCKP